MNLLYFDGRCWGNCSILVINLLILFLCASFIMLRFHIVVLLDIRIGYVTLFSYVGCVQCSF